MTSLSVNNQVSAWYRRQRLMRLMRRLRKVAGDRRNWEISVALISTKDIRRANAQYRHKNKPTSVLSFLWESSAGCLNGEILLCPAVIHQEAKGDDLKYSQHLERLFCHGVLHLLGYQHDTQKANKIMLNLEKKIL